MTVKWKMNLAGFAALRNDPTLVSAMVSAAHQGAAGTPFEVRVEAWPHQGYRSGPRTSVQVWAETFDARLAVNRRPSDLTAVLNRARL